MKDTCGVEIVEKGIEEYRREACARKDGLRFGMIRSLMYHVHAARGQ
jgi:hypothetical protein